MNIHDLLLITALVLLLIHILARVPLWPTVGALLLLLLTGCALETPRAYFQIPHTDYSAYVYAGGGISKTSNTGGK